MGLLPALSMLLRAQLSQQFLTSDRVLADTQRRFTHVEPRPVTAGNINSRFAMLLKNQFTKGDGLMLGLRCNAKTAPAWGRQPSNLWGGFSPEWGGWEIARVRGAHKA